MAIVIWLAAVFGILTFSGVLMFVLASLHTTSGKINPKWANAWVGTDSQIPYEAIYLVLMIFGFGLTIWNISKLTVQSVAVDKTLLQSVMDTIADQNARADLIFVEHPELRKYFYHDIEITAKDPKYEQVQALAEYMLDYLYNVLVLFERFQGHPGQYEQDQQSWRNYTKDIYANSPSIRSLFKERENWYPPQDEEKQNLSYLFHQAKKHHSNSILCQ